jgi:hypothetical protein
MGSWKKILLTLKICCDLALVAMVAVLVDAALPFPLYVSVLFAFFFQWLLNLRMTLADKIQ